MSRKVAGVARLVGGAAIIAVLVWRLGTAPFLDGLRRVDGSVLLAALAITALTTVCSAARWRLIARGLGAGLPLSAAIAGYYRSQFLNSALPGGVLGDLHRGVRQGRDTGDVGRGLRAMAWDRAAGQLVQAGLAVPVLLLPTSPVRSVLLIVVLFVAAGALLATIALRRPPRRASPPPRRASRPLGGGSRLARLGRAVRLDLRRGLLGRPATIGLASTAVVAGHAAIFLIAARSAGVSGSLSRLVPLAMLALLAMSVPLSVAGWGAREGVAAWAFGAAGFGADQGVATATVYGVLAFAATLPGAVLLVAERLRAASSNPASSNPASSSPALSDSASRAGGPGRPEDYPDRPEDCLDRLSEDCPPLPVGSAAHG